jgi:glutathione peroxidase
MDTVYSFTANRIDGENISLASFKGQLLLVVNTASRCGFTPQYQGLEGLYREFKAQGFTVLGFPCNQFGQQEPGDSQEISAFCDLNYGVSFPLFEKIEVNGEHAHPLFQYLKATAPGVLGTQAIKWNFTKFLVGRDGKAIKRYPPLASPAMLRKDILGHL